MKTKSLFFLIIFLIIPFLSFAEDINLAVPCDGGGDIELNGAWNPITGEVNFTLKSTDCIQNEASIVGEGSVSGLFQLSPVLTTATIELSTSFEATMIKGEETVTSGYEQHSEGTYNMLTQKLDGKMTSSWASSGSVNVDLMKLLSINWSDTLVY